MQAADFYSIDELEALTPYTEKMFEKHENVERQQEEGAAFGLKKFNTADSRRVEQLADAIDQCCILLATQECISLKTPTGEMLSKWFTALQTKISGLSSTDYVLGLAGAEVIIEDGGQLNSRKGELSSILSAVKTSEGVFDWSAFTEAKRIRIAKLLMTMGAGCRIEEYNRIADVDQLHIWLAQKLSVLENNYGFNLFRLDNILVEVTRYPQLERELLGEGAFMRILFAEIRHRPAFIAKQSPCLQRLRKLGELLDIDPFVLSRDDKTKKREITPLFERTESIHHVMGDIACHARRDLADQVVIITKHSLDRLAEGDVVTGIGALLNGVFLYRAQACVDADADGGLVLLKQLKKSERLCTDRLTPEDFNKSWRVTLDDLCDMGNHRIKQTRTGAYYMTRGEAHESVFDESHVCNPLFNRLVIYNLNKKLKGRQRLVIDPVFAAHLSYSHVNERGERVLLNPGHAIAGTQFGLMMPLVYGDYEGLTEVRFYRERRDLEHAYQLSDLPNALAYTEWIKNLMEVYLKWWKPESAARTSTIPMSTVC